MYIMCIMCMRIYMYIMYIKHTHTYKHIHEC